MLYISVEGGLLLLGNCPYMHLCVGICVRNTNSPSFLCLANNGSEMAGVPAHLSDIFAFIACYFIKQCLLLFNNMTLNVVGLLRRHFLSKQSASSV